MASTLHPFQKKIQENRDSGMDRAEAVRQARYDDPEAFADWISKHNQRHGGVRPSMTHAV